MGAIVDFGPTKLLTGFLGITAGAAIAVGVPWVVLTNAASAGQGGFATSLLSLIGIAGGVALAIVGVILSIVIPRKADAK
jgi:hypothetical protein